VDQGEINPWSGSLASVDPWCLDINRVTTNEEAGRKRSGSSRSLVPRVLNALLWLVFCAMAGTGLLLAFRLPPGSQGGAGLTAMGWGRHEWGDVHTWLSYAFLALIAAHLALHWRWFWQVAAKKHAWPLVVGIGAGLLLMMWLAFQPVEQRGKGKGGMRDRAAESRR
jgi:hypothetical protein